jgi:hypothetical protein
MPTAFYKKKEGAGSSAKLRMPEAPPAEVRVMVGRACRCKLAYYHFLLLIL